MCAALIGGMDRLRQEYINAARKQGISLRCFNGGECGIETKLGSPDVLIMFTNMISHEARKKVVAVARGQTGSKNTGTSPIRQTTKKQGSGPRNSKNTKKKKN